MRTVWKFPLQLGSPVQVTVGEHVRGSAKVVVADIDPDTGQPAIWIEHHPGGFRAQRTYVVVGTGQLIPDGNMQHVGSMIDRQNGYVWHVYEGI